MLLYVCKKKEQQPEREVQIMKLYSALVKDGNRLVEIKNEKYATKADFIHDLRANGYKVNPKKVKESRLYDYIIAETNLYPWDWDLKSIPCN